MGRQAVSRPVAQALADGLLPQGTSFFDYGCGRGGDLRRLAILGYVVDGWDPAYRPNANRLPAAVVNFGYVANVIEDPAERADALRSAWQLAQEVLVVAARPDWEARAVHGRPFGDGLLMGKGTFQKFYSQDELRSWI